jgi:hypothetical protein
MRNQCSDCHEMMDLKDTIVLPHPDDPTGDYCVLKCPDCANNSEEKKTNSEEELTQ